MDALTLAGLALALAVDAFAVAMATAASLPRVTARHLFRLSWHFGLFQGIMPVIGWYLGAAVVARVATVDHWIAFGLLALLGGRMIVSAVGDGGNRIPGDPTRGWSLMMLSIATSIDALAGGVTLAMLGVPVWRPALIIGLVALALSATGVLLGQRIGLRWGRRAEFAGGLVLIALGLRILADHLGGAAGGPPTTAP